MLTADRSGIDARNLIDDIERDFKRSGLRFQWISHALEHWPIGIDTEI